MGAPQPMILFLAANPGDAGRLALDREARAIRDELERSHSRQFAFETRWGVTPLDLLRAVRELRPTVVHFAGRGHSESPHGLIVHGDDGRARVVSAAALNRMFGAVGSVRLVVLNACYSAGAADALLPHVDCVVGMTGSIGEAAARAFAIGFYGALAGGEPVATACAHGKAAIGLDVLDGMAQAEQPQLRARRKVARRLAAHAPAQRMLHALGANVRLGVYVTGALGVAAACALLLVMIAVGWRTWFALGESMLDVRVRQLAVQTSESPQPVQDGGAVSAIEAVAATVEGGPLAASTGAHHIELTGAFVSIDYGHRASADARCRLRFAASDDGSVEIERATVEGEPCDHEVVVVAGRKGLDLAIDGAQTVAVAPLARLVLRMRPGTPVTLVARGSRLALFRPHDGVIWRASRLEGVVADGQRVRLPGALRSSDSFEVDGSVELREIRTGDGQLAITAALRGWSGRVGRADDWDSAAPWPPSLYCRFAAAALIVLVVGALVRARLRWRAWESELT
jgi:hypothetical protein